VDHVPNSDLHPADIPAAGASWEDIWRFADTFQGYKHWGSFEACARIANEQRHATLTDLRTCLFFECRRWQHYGDDPDEEAEPYVRGLVAEITKRVASGDIADD
jgi:hypothetical protein